MIRYRTISHRMNAPTRARPGSGSPFREAATRAGCASPSGERSARLAPADRLADRRLREPIPDQLAERIHQRLAGALAQRGEHIRLDPGHHLVRRSDLAAAFGGDLDDMGPAIGA